jgi:hypothetical protein
MTSWLGRHLWVIPLVFAVALTAAGVSALRALEADVRGNLQSEVEATLETAVAGVEVWVQNNEAVVELQLRDRRFRNAIASLAKVARTAENPTAALRAAPEQEVLREILNEVAEVHGFIGWGAQDVNGLMLTSQSEIDIGSRPVEIEDRRREAATEGGIGHTPPMIYDTESGDSVLMVVGGAVVDEHDRIVGTFGFYIDPAVSFERLLSVAQLGDSGEIYAFDQSGLMVSRSRFEDELRGLGILPDDPEASSMLQVEIRAPGGDLTAGYVPVLPMKARPFTKAAAAALAGESGHDIDGYPDYRGVSVVGAWSWVPSLRIGLVSEMDLDEAYAGLRAVQLRLGLLLGLLVLAVLGMGGYSIVVARLQGKVDEGRQLGRYRVERKLGKGGMGTVYLARHALLRRPTAIKVLEAESAGGEAVTRFEREVQVSSSLTHPNTIEIYDYGHSPQGDFYYAMEYVGGITLGTLVEKDGPQPDARVRFIMAQVAGSLAEAHALGLIHRDIKPANIMLCERGGMLDFVKVLDFGLVRAQQQSQELAITRTQALTGTPLYMAPEALENPSALDAPGDVYQLGAVAYYLITGRPPFEGKGLVEVLAKHMKEHPASPSEATGRAVSPALEEIILRCLSKAPEDRFENATALLAALEAATVDGSWGQPEARAWWAAWTEAHGDEVEGPSGAASSTPSGYTIDLLDRMKRSRS